MDVSIKDSGETLKLSYHPIFVSDQDVHCDLWLLNHQKMIYVVNLLDLGIQFFLSDKALKGLEKTFWKERNFSMAPYSGTFLHITGFICKIGRCQISWFIRTSCIATDFPPACRTPLGCHRCKELRGQPFQAGFNPRTTRKCGYGMGLTVCLRG